MLQGKRVDTKAQRDECMMWNSHVMHDMKFTWINIKLKKKKEKKEKNCWVWWFAYNLSTQQTEAKFFDFRATLGYILSPKTELRSCLKIKETGLDRQRDKSKMVTCLRKHSRESANVTILVEISAQTDSVCHPELYALDAPSFCQVALITWEAKPEGKSELCADKTFLLSHF